MATPTISSLRGTGMKQISMPTMNSDQQQLLSQLLGGLQPGVGKGLSQLGNMASGSQEGFEQMEAPALRQFAGLQGNLASRFSGMGGSGSRKSSGFQNQMGEQAADLSERLQSQRLGFQQDAIRQLLGLSESLLGKRPFETAFIAKKMPFWQKILGAGIGGGSSLGFGKLFGAF